MKIEAQILEMFEVSWTNGVIGTILLRKNPMDLWVHLMKLKGITVNNSKCKQIIRGAFSLLLCCDFLKEDGETENLVLFVL